MRSFCLLFGYACFLKVIFQRDWLGWLLSNHDTVWGSGVLVGVCAVDVWDVLNIKLLAVQNKKRSQVLGCFAVQDVSDEGK